MSSLILSPLIAEAAFKKMLPSDAVLGVDERSEYCSQLLGVWCVVRGFLRVRRSTVRQRERLGQLRMCQSVSVRWIQAGHLSLAALLVRCMCCQVGVVELEDGHEQV